MNDITNQSKPKRDALGLDVKYESEDIEVNPTASKLLRGAGETCVSARGTYKGSIAMHLFTNEMGNQIGMIEQFTAHDVSEQVLLMAYQTLGIHLARRFGHKQGTTNKKDRR